MACCGVGTQAYDCNCERLWIRFLLEETKYFIFSFPRSDNKAKYGMEFRHSKRNSLQNSAENGEQKSFNGNGLF